jgi:hypothetical protein
VHYIFLYYKNLLDESAMEEKCWFLLLSRNRDDAEFVKIYTMRTENIYMNKVYFFIFDPDTEP